MSVMTLRPLVEADARPLAEMHLATWRAAYGSLLPRDAFDSIDVEARAAQWRERARGEAVPATTTLVAEAAGTLVGFVSFGPPRDEPPPAPVEIYALYVAPPQWQTGAGKALLRAALDRIGGPAYLWVLEANDRARRFYEAQGFSPDGTGKPVDLFGTMLPEVRYVHPGRDSDGR